jgi:hypothetical protein
VPLVGPSTYGPFVLALAAAALLSALVLTGGAFATDVHGDDEQDRYVGTGGLLLPRSVDEATRRRVSTCMGCQWRLATPCILSPLGNSFAGQSPCMSVIRGCPAGDQLLRGWFRPGVGPWREVGLVCIGDDGPVTVRHLAQEAADRFVEGMPRLEPTFQPASGAVVQVPVVFATGQPAGGQAHEYGILGRQVHLDAKPEWSWDFGDAASMHTRDPGGPYPHDTVAHPYRRSGEYTVTVTTQWSASFTVDGLGPFDVPEPVTQRARVPVLVGEGRALLTP